MIEIITNSEMSDIENESITSDYFSESTPQSCKSVALDHKYALSPPVSLRPNDSPKRHRKSHKVYKRRKLFTTLKDYDKESKVIPLSERQQLAIALQLSVNQSKNETKGLEIGSNETNDALIRSKLKIRRNYKGETDLHIAAIRGDLNRVESIIAQSHHDIDIADFAGWAPIHEACNRGFTSIVEELLKAGSNVNALGYNNDTPLIDAAVNGHHCLVELLLKYGADYSLKNSSGKTALEVAKTDRVVSVITNFIEEKMRRNGGNKEKDIVSSVNNNSSPPKPTSPRLTLRFQSIKDKNTSVVTQTQSSTCAMTSTKSYSVSTTIDKDKDNNVEPYVSDKQNDTHNKSNNNSNGSTEAVSASSDHNYTSIDSTLNSGSDDGSRGRKRRKSNDGSVSSTSLSSTGPSPSRSSSTSSVASSTQQSSSHNKKHHHHHHHHTSHHHSSKNVNNINVSKEKTTKKLYSSSSDSEGVDGTETADKDSNNKDNNQTLNSSVVNSSGSSTTTETIAPKVPPLRIVLPANTSNSTSTVHATTSSNGSTQSFVSSAVTSTTSSSMNKFPYVVSSSDESFQCESDSVSGSIGSQRITRSSQRVAQQQSQKTNSGIVDHSDDSEESIHTSVQADSQHPRKRKIRNNNENKTKDNVNNTTINSNNNNNSNINTTSVNNNKEGDNDNDSSSSSSSINGLTPKEISPFALPSTNCYQMFLSIRKHVDKKRKEMFSVQPKPPEGFKDYLLNRCSYTLEGQLSRADKSVSSSLSSKPTLNTAPNTLTPGSGMYDLFCEQEKQRYKLKIQHIIEREKLTLSTEQEILRVHGRAARAMANQNVPFSVCSILKDEEIYNVSETETEQNETISNQIKIDKPLATGLTGRTRYNGRLFISWLQDVDDKWDKIKQTMLLRHKKESESLLAMQKLEWEWKLKELGLCDVKSNPIIEDKYVPAVHVSEEFDKIH